MIVGPRRTVTVNACEVEAGQDNVLHLAVNSGTDTVLFNALSTHIAEEGWVDQKFIDAHTATPGTEPADSDPADSDPATMGRVPGRGVAEAVIGFLGRVGLRTPT